MEKETKLVAEVTESASGLFALAKTLPKVKPKGNPKSKFSFIILISEASKARRAAQELEAAQKLEPGKALDFQLKTIEKLISKKRKEIKALRHRLTVREHELDQEGLTVIGDICRAKTLQRLKPLLRKGFL